MTPKLDLIVVGGGLAGSEAAWQAADARSFV
jgi:folate-dependent tRNA-U54 methylase TrmFO/GidA